MSLLILINKLANDDSRNLFLKLNEQQNYNIMFRQAATKAEYLEIAEFLYENKSEFKIDINGTGQSKKSALDFAIERNAKENVVFLLKLKETLVDDQRRAKIFSNFGNDFRTVNISTPYYVPLGDKLIELNPKVNQATLEYSKKLSSLVEDLKIKAMDDLKKAKAINEVNNINEVRVIRQQVLINMKYFVDNFLIEVSTLGNVLESFEDLFNNYLPYSYAQEKLLQGNEFAKSNLNSSMKNTCLKNRERLGETLAAVHHNKIATISNFDEVMQLYVLILVFFEERLPSLNETNFKDNDTDNQPEISEPSIIVEPMAEIEPFYSEEEQYKQYSNKIRNNTTSPKEACIEKPNAKLARLKDLCEEINQLKQKGQVKFSVFQSIIKNLSEEINLELKQTKKGFLVSQSSNQFSFHRPHKDKGVDKAAVQSLKNLVNENIEQITNSKK